jgi:aspartyl-tRNA(Asn)/glutamyl-tRNA(Gln) amidotransferase subunit A
VRAAIDALARAGASLVEVEIPFAAQIMAVEFGLCLPEASAYYREMLRERADLYQQDVRTFLQAGELIPATDYITALRVRQKMKQAWAAMFAGIDVLIGPAVAAPATRRDQDSVRWPDGTMEPVTPVFVRLSASANVTGLPSSRCLAASQTIACRSPSRSSAGRSMRRRSSRSPGATRR